jgi:O-antigen/teichoic acid export membrane protein
VPRPARAAVLAGLAFGLPMMASELSGVVFGMADRILLRGLTGSLEQVGVYTIGYGLAMAIGTLAGASLNQAFTPTALRRFEVEGAEAVRRLKQRMLDHWIHVVALATALLLCGGADALVLLAGTAKAASAPVFVIVAVCLVWHSLFEVANYGLLLQRRAMRYLQVMLLATAIKLMLSIPLILHYGVVGAAVATALGYVALATLQYRQCPPSLRYLPPARRLLASIALPLALMAVLQGFDHFGARSAAMRLLVAGAWVALAASAYVALDPDLRRRLRAAYHARTRRVPQ